jgi:hypothetical protein
MWEWIEDGNQCDAVQMDSESKDDVWGLGAEVRSRGAESLDHG